MNTKAENKLLLLKHQEKEAVGQASGLADVFVAATGRFVAQWIGDQVKATVTSEHEHTLSLGTDRLKELKAGLAAAQQAAPAATKKALMSLPWAFRSPGETGNTSGSPGYFRSPLAPASKGRAPNAVTEPLRVILGEAGRILDQFGYPKAADWKKSGGYRYAYGLDLSEEANAALDAAARADEKVLELRWKIGDLEREIGESRAKAAWDEL